MVQQYNIYYLNAYLLSLRYILITIYMIDYINIISMLQKGQTQRYRSSSVNVNYLQNNPNPYNYISSRSTHQYNICKTHNREYDLIGNRQDCQLNCLICCQCLREMNHGHKKNNINHETITIQQFAHHYKTIRNHSAKQIEQCYSSLDKYIDEIIRKFISDINQQKIKLQKFIQRIMLTEVTTQTNELNLLQKISQGKYQNMTCKDVSRIATKFFSYVPENISPGYGIFIKHLEDKKIQMDPLMGQILNSGAYKALIIQNVVKATEYPQFYPKRQYTSKAKTQETPQKVKKTPHKTIHHQRQFSESPKKQSNLNQFRVHIKKPIEFVGSFLIQGKDSNAFIQKLFHKRILNAKMLYRASQNNFSVNKFHDLCDGEPYTLTVLATQFGKIIGGFTTIPWRSTNNTLHSDIKKESFLFSLSLKQKMDLVDEKSATFNSVNFGPTFGAGADLAICHNADQQKTSYAQFPYSYSNTRYQSNHQHSTTLFTGQKNGNHFFIREWEVWRLFFKED